MFTLTLNPLLKYLLFLSLIIPARNLNAQSDLQPFHDKTFSTAYGKTFILKAGSGDSKIITWDREEINVKVYANNEAQEKMNFIFNESGEGLTVEEEYKDNRNESYRNIKIRYEISIPRRYNANVSTASGNLDVDNLEGNLKITSASGDIKTGGITGNVNATTASGDITLSSVDGNTTISTASGDINCSSLTGNIDASTASGDIVLTGNSGQLELSTASGDISVNYNGSNMGTKISTVSGDIRFNYSGGFSADLNANSMSGDIKLAGNIINTDRDERRKRNVTSTINGGGSALHCSTISGDISIGEN